MKNEVFLSLSIQELQQIIQDAVRAEISVLHSKDLHKSSNTEYFSRNQVAKMLNISLRSLAKYIKEGKIPAKRLGGKYYFVKTDVEASVKTISSIKYSRRNQF